MSPYRITFDGEYWWVRHTRCDARDPATPLLCLTEGEAVRQCARLTREYERRHTPRSGVLAQLRDGERAH